jgi:uncharacterized protein YkwD
VISRGLLLSVLLLSVNACGGSSAGEPSVASPDSSGDAASGGDHAPSDVAAVVDAHNQLRAKHCAPPLVWSDTLARTAKRWADHLASAGCRLEHSRNNYGENLAGGSTGTLSPEEVARVWYREHERYDFHKGSFSMHTGHFTQLVWVGTKRIGCAVASCPSQEVWVCNYDPPGNMEGDYARNVLPTSCRPK